GSRRGRPTHVTRAVQGSARSQRMPVVALIYLFFFQAEDGIRDLYVTGVQTCALPIFQVAAPSMTEWPSEVPRVPTNRSPTRDARSEERRVGKECRAPWSAYSQKRKIRVAGTRRAGWRVEAALEQHVWRD